MDDEVPPKPLVERDECALSIVLDAEMHLYEFRAEFAQMDDKKTLEECCWFMRRVVHLVEGDGVLLLLYGEVGIYKEIQEFILEVRAAIQKRMEARGEDKLPLYWDYEGETLSRYKFEKERLTSHDLYCDENGLYDSE